MICDTIRANNLKCVNVLSDQGSVRGIALDPAEGLVKCLVDDFTLANLIFQFLPQCHVLRELYRCEHQAGRDGRLESNDFSPSGVVAVGPHN